MSVLGDTITADLSVIADDLGNPILTWSGEDYECLPGSAGESVTLSVGGFEVVADVVLVVRRKLFTDGILPEEQQRVTYNDKVYRIGKVNHDSTGAMIRLFLTAASKGV